MLHSPVSPLVLPVLISLQWPSVTCPVVLPRALGCEVPVGNPCPCLASGQVTWTGAQQVPMTLDWIAAVIQALCS